jgi:hypothetical protein
MYAISLKSVSIAAAILIAAAGGAAAQGQGASAQASAQGPSNVNVVNVPTVTVGNTELQPIPVKEPLKQPVHLEFRLQIVQPFSVSNVGSFAVPAGKRLTIEHMSLACFSDTQKDAFAELLVDGRPLSYLPAKLFLTGGAFARAVGAGPVNTSVDQGSVRVFVHRSDGSETGSDSSGTTNCSVTVLGYLTPLQ